MDYLILSVLSVVYQMMKVLCFQNWNVLIQLLVKVDEKLSIILHYYEVITLAITLDFTSMAIMTMVVDEAWADWMKNDFTALRLYLLQFDYSFLSKWAGLIIGPAMKVFKKQQLYVLMVYR